MGKVNVIVHFDDEEESPSMQLWRKAMFFKVLAEIKEGCNNEKRD